LRIVKPVGKQRNAAQLEGCRIVLGILSGHSRVEFASFGELPNWKSRLAESISDCLGWDVACPEKLHGARITAKSWQISFRISAITPEVYQKRST
jgi:hypothetical protein